MYTICTSNQTVKLSEGGMYRVMVYSFSDTNQTKFDIGSHTDWIMFGHVEECLYRFQTTFVTKVTETAVPLILSATHIEDNYIRMQRFSRVRAATNNSSTNRLLRSNSHASCD